VTSFGLGKQILRFTWCKDKKTFCPVQARRWKSHPNRACGVLFNGHPRKRQLEQYRITPKDNATEDGRPHAAWRKYSLVLLVFFGTSQSLFQYPKNALKVTRWQNSLRSKRHQTLSTYGKKQTSLLTPLSPRSK